MHKNYGYGGSMIIFKKTPACIYIPLSLLSIEFNIAKYVATYAQDGNQYLNV